MCTNTYGHTLSPYQNIYVTESFFLEFKIQNIESPSHQGPCIVRYRIDFYHFIAARLLLYIFKRYRNINHEAIQIMGDNGLSLPINKAFDLNV